MPTYSIKFNQDKKSKSTLQQIIKRIQQGQSYEDLNNDLISHILDTKSYEKIDQSPLKSQHHGLSGPLFIAIEEDDNGKIIKASSMFGEATGSVIQNNNEEKFEKSTRVFIKHNNKSEKLHGKSLKDNNTFKTMVNQSLQSTDSLSPCPFRQDDACRVLNQSQFPKSYVVDLISDEEGNFIRIDSTFGSVNAQDLEESPQSTIEDYLLLNEFEIVSSEDSKPNNNNNNQVEEPSPVFFHKCKAGLTNEDLHVYKTHYDGNAYSLTIDDNGRQIYAIQDKKNFQRYNTIQPQDVPQEVKNSFEEYFEDKIEDVVYDRNATEFSYEDQWYKLIPNSEGCSFYVLNEYNPHQYDQISSDLVPPEVKRISDNLLKQVNPDLYYNQKINNIDEALSNNDLWKEDGKHISSVPKKLLRIINNDNYSPSEKYSLLIKEATHQQQQKRGKFGSIFKGGQRPEQVNELLRNIIDKKDVDIENLSKLAATSNNNNNENKTFKFKRKLNDYKKDNDGLHDDTNIFKL